MTQGEVSIVEGGPERLDEIEPVWRSLYELDRSVSEAEAGAVIPYRERPDSWAHRRARFERWLGEPGAFMLVAEGDGRPVGFALVRVGEGGSTFDTGERLAELEAIAVEPEARRHGVGSLLMEAVHRRLAGEGIGFIGLSVIAGNDDALRFYERWGMRRSHIRCLGPVHTGL